MPGSAYTAAASLLPTATNHMTLQIYWRRPTSAVRSASASGRVITLEHVHGKSTAGHKWNGHSVCTKVSIEKNQELSGSVVHARGYPAVILQAPATMPDVNDRYLVDSQANAGIISIGFHRERERERERRDVQFSKAPQTQHTGTPEDSNCTASERQQIIIIMAEWLSVQAASKYSMSRTSDCRYIGGWADAVCRYVITTDTRCQIAPNLSVWEGPGRHAWAGLPALTSFHFPLARYFYKKVQRSGYPPPHF